ncbi:MAG: DUF86 domain-containing protein [Armatimonadetes bacterium]|nr:DUF86 domain-containing protein [Armatimonadota bacterium]MBS1726032.1 DUF86 domain-containing protein [Armatimonadota bacterium]
MLLSDLQKLMPTANSLPHLAGIYDGLAEAIEYSRAGKDHFLTSRENQAAIMYRLLCAGESAKQFCDENLTAKRPRGTRRIEQANPDVSKVGLTEADWEQLFEIRDHLAHELQTLDKERVWSLVEKKSIIYRDSVFEALKHCSSGWLSSPPNSTGQGDSVARAKRDLNDDFMTQVRNIMSQFNTPASFIADRAVDSMFSEIRQQIRDVSRAYLDQINEDIRRSCKQ